MGVFKPLLPVGEQPAVLRCIHIAKSAGIREILVVTGHMHAVIESVLRANTQDVRLVYNSRYRDGMFSSIQAGVSELPETLDGFFLLPADCCAISPDTLTTLMEWFAENGGSLVTRPKYHGKRGHPPLIPAGYITPLLMYKGENGLKSFLSPLPTLEVEMDSPAALLDMDTPDGYAELLSYLGLPVYPDSDQCAELFSKYNTPQEIIEHGEQVAALALKIARLMEAHEENHDSGQAISYVNKEQIKNNSSKPSFPTPYALTPNPFRSKTALQSACLLHDICRMTPDHARAGMELLLREGYPGAATLVGRHMDLPCFAGDIGEAELLFLADKICRRNKLATLEDTERELEQRYAKDPTALDAAKERIKIAQSIMDALKEQYNIVP